MNAHHSPIHSNECPWHKIAQDRSQHPVVWVDDPSSPIAGVDGYFMVTDNALMKEVLLNAEVFSNQKGTTYYPANQQEDVIAFIDPPKHRFHRQLFSSVFSRSGIDKLRGLVQDCVNDQVDRVIEKGGEFDLMHDFSFPLAVNVIGTLLGVAKEDTPRFRIWATAIEEAVSGIDLENNLKLIDELHHYAGEEAEKRRQMENPPNDLITAVVQAEYEGEKFTDQQAIEAISFLLVAGNSTMSDGMMNVIHSLETNPQEKQKVLHNPDNYVTIAVEEMLRFDGPINGLFREAKQDAVVGGVTIPKGSRVFCFYNAGSHDPSVYPECPDQFKLDRDNRNKGHMAFGWGIHLCIGAKLARLTINNAIYALYQRLPNLRLAEGCQPTQKPGGIVRGWHNISMSWDQPAKGRATLPQDFPPTIV